MNGLKVHSLHTMNLKLQTAMNKTAVLSYLTS